MQEFDPYSRISDAKAVPNGPDAVPEYADALSLDVDNLTFPDIPTSELDFKATQRQLIGNLIDQALREHDVAKHRAAVALRMAGSVGTVTVVFAISAQKLFAAGAMAGATISCVAALCMAFGTVSLLRLSRAASRNAKHCEEMALRLNEFDQALDDDNESFL